MLAVISKSISIGIVDTFTKNYWY